MPTADTDQGGVGFQRVKVYLGPTLGWVMQQVRPTDYFLTGGTKTLQPGASVAFVNVAATVTINLPSVAAWIKETAYMPNTGFERAIWIKDLGGHAASFNITIHQFTGNSIDTVGADYVMNTDHQIARLYPLNDLTGWYTG